jgi:hypothetical protein
MLIGKVQKKIHVLKMHVEGSGLPSTHDITVEKHQEVI